MTDKSPVDREEVIQLDLPQKNIKEGLMGLFFRQYSILASVLAEVTSATDLRISFLTDLIINTVPDDEYRDELRKEKTEMMISKRKEFKAANADRPMSNADEAELLRQVCMELIGRVTSYLDQSIGLSHKLEVRIE